MSDLNTPISIVNNSRRLLHIRRKKLAVATKD